MPLLYKERRIVMIQLKSKEQKPYNYVIEQRHQIVYNIVKNDEKYERAFMTSDEDKQLSAYACNTTTWD